MDRGSLAGYSRQVSNELDTTERLHFITLRSVVKCRPLQCLSSVTGLEHVGHVALLTLEGPQLPPPEGGARGDDALRCAARRRPRHGGGARVAAASSRRVPRCSFSLWAGRLCFRRPGRRADR